MAQGGAAREASAQEAGGAMSTAWNTAAAYEGSNCPGCHDARGEAIFRETWEGVPMEIAVAE
jgi:hypothetical protein